VLDKQGFNPHFNYMKYRTSKFWQPDVTVATVVIRNGQLLMVEELVAGVKVFNQPAGHLEPEESIAEAAIRETLEETGWRVQLSEFIGAYQWTAPETGQHFLRMAFSAMPIEHFPGRALDQGIIAAHWLSPSEIHHLQSQHRSPLVWKVIQDYLAGQRVPLTVVQAL
jgi:8-oxo-dGTP pyrophosphatase MutT (NUDIX family)